MRLFALLSLSLFSLCCVSVTAHSDVNTISAVQAAAECVAAVQLCSKVLADKSGICEEKKYFNQQPSECTKVACEFCYREWAKGYNFCVKSWTIQNKCPEVMAWYTVTPTISSSPSASSSISTSAYILAPASITPTPSPILVSSDSSTGLTEPSASVSVSVYEISPQWAPNYMYKDADEEECSPTPEDMISSSPQHGGENVMQSPSENESTAGYVPSVDSSSSPSYETPVWSQSETGSQAPLVDSSSSATPTHETPDPYEPEDETKESAEPSISENFRAAAECVSANSECTDDMARRSGICEAGKYVNKQPPGCKDMGCAYCRSAVGITENFCRESWSIRNWCPDIYPSVSVSQAPNYENNALCISRADQCPNSYADGSDGCLPFTYVVRQPQQCVDGACSYCARPENAQKLLCGNWAIQIYCHGSPRPSPTTSTTPSITPSISTTASPTASETPTPSLSASVSPSSSISETALPSMSVFSSQSPHGNDEETDVQSSNSFMSTLEPEVTKSATECTWFADDNQLVIPMSRVEPGSYWTRYSDGAHVGIQWRADDDRQEVDPPGLGEVCFRVGFTVPGTYYLTAISAAPHGTEHNDMWIHFNGGLELFDADTDQQMTDPWATPQRTFKAYQNIGGNRIADIISSVNHNPHIFVTQTVSTGTAYRLCIDGRSSQFKVYELVMVRCSGNSCKRNSNYIRDTMADIMLKSQASESVC